MITAAEAKKNAEGLDISEFTAYLSVEISRASVRGQRSITIYQAPYNSIGSNHASPAMVKVGEALLANGFKVFYITSTDQRDPDGVKIEW